MASDHAEGFLTYLIDGDPTATAISFAVTLYKQCRKSHRLPDALEHVLGVPQHIQPLLGGWVFDLDISAVLHVSPS